MVRIVNPVLPGFHPDPSILRVGDVFYLATSTFEFHPAVRIHASRDLANWELVGHALDEGFDLRGVPDSGGVWAPSLSYADGQFWLAYSIVRTMDGDDKDIENYLVTAPEITGPWSEPVYLGSRGFDFSFFHDDDGTHWIVGVQWDHRPDHPSFSGLVLEQYLPDEQRVSGTAHLLYQESGLVEGPNLYRIDGWYYLLIAAGGTGWNHGITVARSRERLGPYERDPQEAVLTTRDAPGHPLQKAGHGELVQLADGRWMLAHLAARPVLHLGERYSTLGRETCLQAVEFDEAGWLRLRGGWHAAETVEIDGLAERPVEVAPARDDFDADELDRRSWATLRAALPTGVADLRARPGWLRLRGGASAASVFDQSMILRRVTEHRTTVSCRIDAEPTSSRQAAGLVLWYDRRGWIWLQVTRDAENGRHVRVVWRDGDRTVAGAPVEVPSGVLDLEADLDGAYVEFAVTGTDGRRVAVPGRFDLWRLSDDHGPRLRFTGLFAGVRVDDLDARQWCADFDYVDVAS
ncbi:family 43 glycosylhydrolase [Microbacterium arborescens]|uniref:family 43 glycosylhydrolase n=1 Tax=Microbacterium arborescens TaxID=33883 RepID=UPI003C712A1E